MGKTDFNLFGANRFIILGAIGAFLMLNLTVVYV